MLRSGILTLEGKGRNALVGVRIIWNVLRAVSDHSGLSETGL